LIYRKCDLNCRLYIPSFTGAVLAVQLFSIEDMELSRKSSSRGCIRKVYHRCGEHPSKGRSLPGDTTKPSTEWSSRKVHCRDVLGGKVYRRKARVYIVEVHCRETIVTERRE
jgi:hypothetical protein